MTNSIRVAILEDHQSTLDGYQFRLGTAPNIEIVGAVRYWVEFEALLAAHPADVALLDIHVPTAPDNPTVYPLFHALPLLLQRYPGLEVLIVSMHTDRTLIESVIEAGASGYILKDDAETIRQLPAVVATVASGGIVISQSAYQQLGGRGGREGETQLTPRQREALSLSASYPEETLADLAGRLGVMNSTARNLLSGAYLRLGVRNRAAAITKAQQLGLISPLHPSLYSG
jgi:DNA-binding NarL/FixJ family response regulator